MANPLLDALLSKFSSALIDQNRENINSPTLSDKRELGRIGPLIDLDKISIRKSIPSVNTDSLPLIRPPALPDPSMGGEVTGIPERSYDDYPVVKGPNKFGEFLKGLIANQSLREILPIAISSIVGLTAKNPDVLAGAAGFNTGYGSGLEKAKEDKLKEEELKYKKLVLKADDKPTFSQKNKIESIKSGLRRRKVTIGREFGEPTNYDIKTIDDAYKAISDAGLDPKLFVEELSDYEDSLVMNPKGKVVKIPKYQLEEALKPENGYKLIK